MLAYYMDTPTLFKSAVEAENILVVAIDCLDSSVKKSTIKSQFSTVTTISCYKCYNSWNKVHPRDVSISWEHKWTS